jgi:hypothetical protein
VIRPGPSFGSLQTISLDNDRVRVVVVPALGARVISFVDRFADREWLVAGDPPADPAAWARRDAVYDGAVAFGWDECLPTVAACADPLDATGPSLRDHGDQWGRPAEVVANGEVLVATWSGIDWPYRFIRRLRLDGPRLVAEYELENHGERELPILWSMHPLLALDPGARVDVEGLASVRVTQAAGVPIGPVPGHVAWPETPGTDGPMIALDLVRERGAGTALKLYGGWELYGSWDSVSGEGLPGVAAVRQPDGSALELTWYAPIAPNLGIWLDDDGWPPAPATPRTQHALEPTTSPDDDVASAVANGRALIVAPAERVAWSATFRVRAPGEPRG